MILNLIIIMMDILIIWAVFKKNGKWVIYKTNHRDGHAYIIDSYDKEEDAFADFYQYVTHQINREKL